MTKLTELVIIAIFMQLCVFNEAYGARVYATSGVVSNSTLIVGSVNQPNRSRDGNPRTFATLGIIASNSEHKFSS